MKIQKYIKDKQNKYKVIIDGTEYVLYDDIIIEYNLLLKQEIDESTFSKVLDKNSELKSYYDSIKYISKRIRSEKEIYEYLLKHEVKEEVIKNTIKKLKEKNFINDEVYIEAYFKDQINLTNNGPKKIMANMLNLGIDEYKIKDKLASIKSSYWLEKMQAYIEKRIKANHTSSNHLLKVKITNDLINLGYEREDILSILNNVQISDNDILKKEYQKAKRTLSNKYSGIILENKIKERLYRKGFNFNDIKELENEE